MLFWITPEESDARAIDIFFKQCGMKPFGLFCE